MYVPHIKQNVRDLRKQGCTIKEIRDQHPFLAKGTVSTWVSDIALTPTQEQRIINKQLAGREIFVAYNAKRKKASEAQLQDAIQKARHLIGTVTIRDLTVIGAALFWAEGTKRARHVIEFVNSDPSMIQLMLRFLRKILGIPENKFRYRLTIHPGIDEDGTLQYWSDITNIPRTQFQKIQQKPPRSSQRKMHNILYRGTLRIVVCDTKARQHPEGLLQAIKM